jgi:hypothetical protein
MDNELSKRIRDLPPEQLARLLQDLQQPAQRAAPATREKPASPPPLSFAQRRLWFLHQLQPESAAYHALDALRLRGPLDSEILTRSLNAIMQRHEVLRTTFVERDGEPVQVVADAASWPLECVDLRSLESGEHEIEIRRWAEEQQHRPFDLARGPLVQATLLRLDCHDHVLLLRLHHVVADGWSMGILRRELAEYYRAFSRGHQPNLLSLSFQYADFAVWQRAELTGQRLADQLGYWRRRLLGMPPLRLPADQPRSTVFSDRGAAVARELPRALLEAISAVGQSVRATRFMTLMAAFQVLLARYSGQTDFAVGTPISNRGRCEWEDLVGFFVNTLVFRADTGGDPTFREYLVRVRDTALDAYAHQDLPFEMLVQELAPERDPSRNPLFQVMFGVYQLPPMESAVGELTVDPVDFEITTNRFDLEINLWEHAQGLRAVAFYRVGLFARSSIERLQEHFEQLLLGIAADPDRRLSELPLMTDNERRTLLVTWNTVPAQTPASACLHELFAAQAARTPEAVAISAAGESWTYRQLDQRAERLAEQLRAWGVGADVPVGLCLRRSPQLVAAILAVLKAGGAYVPLEPDLPRARLEYVLTETRVPVLLTAADALQNLPEVADAAVYCMDTDSVKSLPGRRGPSPAAVVGPLNLAYLMYTSGSTGRPKGVAVTHQNVVRLLQTTQQQFGFGADDVWTLFHSYAFDFSVWEIWGALAVRRSVGCGAVGGGAQSSRVLSVGGRARCHGLEPDAYGLLPIAAGRRAAAGGRPGCAMGDFRGGNASIRLCCLGGSHSPARRRRGWRTCTGLRRRRFTRRCTRSPPTMRARQAAAQSAGGWQMWSSTFSTRTETLFRAAFLAQSTWGAPDWPAATGTIRL